MKAPLFELQYSASMKTVRERWAWLRPALGIAGKPVLILVAGLALLWGCSWLYGVWPDGTFAREVVIALIGAIITLITTGLVAVVALRRQIEAAWERRTLRVADPDAWTSRAIRCGELEIPDMTVIVSCTHRTPWTERASAEFRTTDERRPRHALVEETRRLWLPTIVKKAEAGDYIFSDDEGVDLVSAEQTTRRVPGQSPRTHFRFKVAPSSYSDFACSNAKLDEQFTLDGETDLRSLRERWAVTPRSILDVGQLPASAVIGSSTVVVTSDNRFVFGVRDRTFIAGRNDSTDARQRPPVHFVAEGLQIKDLDQDGNFSPLAGSYRALRQELGVSKRSDSIARPNEVVPTGFAFDNKRWQPYFTFIARVDTTWKDLETGCWIAQDHWEAARLESLPFDIGHVGVRKLLIDDHPDFVLASNHAKLALWFALLFQHGYHHLRDELTVPDV